MMSNGVYNLIVYRCARTFSIFPFSVTYWWGDLARNGEGWRGARAEAHAARQSVADWPKSLVRLVDKCKVAAAAVRQHCVTIFTP